MKNINAEAEINKVEEQVCPSCGFLVDFNTTFCSNCNAPISLLSNVDPLQTIRAEGVLYRRMTVRKPKIIVIIGSWLLFFPGVVGGLFLAMTTIIEGIGGRIRGFLTLLDRCYHFCCFVRHPFSSHSKLLCVAQ
ncbi:MAG: zinc ribbon domain-containing protein [Blastocatellia bacterium]|nr:zinc ribbon domain-containing protein [Blastocatellia bacterium]